MRRLKFQKISNKQSDRPSIQFITPRFSISKRLTLQHPPGYFYNQPLPQNKHRSFIKSKRSIETSIELPDLWTTKSKQLSKPTNKYSTFREKELYKHKRHPVSQQLFSSSFVIESEFTVRNQSLTKSRDYQDSIKSIKQQRAKKKQKITPYCEIASQFEDTLRPWTKYTER